MGIDGIRMSRSKTHEKFALILVCAFLLLFSSQVFGDSDSGSNAEDEDHKKSLAPKYKSGAIASIFLASLVGVCLPMLGKMIPSLSSENDVFFVVKTFAAGVSLATGFIHVLPDAFESLTSPCLPENPWGYFPFTRFVEMVAAIEMLMVDVYATSHYKRKSAEKSKQVAVAEDGVRVLPLHTHATHGHAHSSVSTDSVTTHDHAQIKLNNLKFLLNDLKLKTVFN